MSVNNKSDFVNALNTPNVGTIITGGAEIEFEVIKWFQAKENKYDITRDLRILSLIHILIDDDQNIINILKLIIQNRNLGEICGTSLKDVYKRQAARDKEADF